MTSVGSPVSTTDVDPWTRLKDQDAALSIKAAAFPHYTAGGFTMTSQTVFGAGVYLYAGETITNIVCCVSTAAAGTAPTSLKLGLWSSAATPACVASTADLAADSMWTTGGWKVAPLSSPYSVPSSGLYYASFWQNGAFGTTPLQTYQGTSFGLFGGFSQAGYRHAGFLATSRTTHVVTDTGSYNNGGGIPWLAVS